MNRPGVGAKAIDNGMTSEKREDHDRGRLASILG